MREAYSTPPPPPVASEKTLRIHTTDFAPLDDPSALDKDLKRKRRKRGSGAGAIPNSYAAVKMILSSKPNESSTSVQPQTSYEAALLPGLAAKLSLIGGKEVMKDLRQAVFCLCSYGYQYLLIPSCIISAPYNGAGFSTTSFLRPRRYSPYSGTSSDCLK